MKFDAISSTNTTVQTVLAKWDETTDIRTYRFIIQTDSTGRAFPKFQISTDGTAANIKTATGKTQVIAAQWYLLTGYFNATSPGTLYIYVNGVRDGSTASVGTSLTDTSAGFYLGATKTGAATYANFLGGSLDELRLFTGTRTDGAISYSMERGKPVIDITFDDGSGVLAIDHSPETNRGALVNFPTDNSQWVAGQSNTYGLSFAGTDDYVDLGNRPKLQLGGAITISLWINPTNLSSDYTLVSQPHTNGYTFKITTGGEMTFGALGATTVTSSGAAITAGTWQYVTVSYDGANVSFYKDGRLISSPALALWTVTDGAVFVGKAGSTPQYFNGKMDELRIYPYNRTAFEVYVDRNKGLVVFGRQQSLQPRNAQVACPSGYVYVPGDPMYGTSGFCAGKYEAKCASTSDLTVGLTAPDAGYNTYADNTTPCTAANSKAVVSVASGYPIANITQTDSITRCSALGAKYHLITNAEWMTIARNIEKYGSNWCDSNGSNCGFSPGQSSKLLASGHNDNSPAYALAASADDSQACYGTVTRDVNTTCGSAGTQKRNHTLSNGNVIWDTAGNVWEWTNDTITGANEPTGSSTGFAWREFTALTTYGTLSYDLTRPFSSAYDATYGIGRIYSDGTPSNSTVYGFLRSGDWDNGTNAGVFALNLSYAPGDSSVNVGFRGAASL